MFSPHDPYAHARHEMLENQLRQRGVVMHTVLEAMRLIPRHQFVAHEFADRAYADEAIPSRDGQTISQPFMVGIMTQELALCPGQRVLEIGTGTGYQTAILAHLVGPNGRVCTIERIPSLTQFARRHLATLDLHNVQYLIGDGSAGWPHPQDLPFDRILVTAGAPAIPPPLRAQLADGGILLAPIGPADAQMLTRLERQGDMYTEKRLFSCRFVPLLGVHAWNPPPASPHKD